MTVQTVEYEQISLFDDASTQYVLYRNKLKILELFAGTRSVSKAFEAHGHEVYCVEWDKRFSGIDWYEDVGKITARDILDRFGHPDVIWASPDCSSYSVAAISKHRRKEPDGSLTPVTEYARFCDQTNEHVTYAKIKGTDACPLTNPPPKPTKADRIRAMTDDELADLLSGMSCRRCPIDCKGGMYNCVDIWLDWLREEAENG